MKKIFSLFLAVILIFVMASCTSAAKVKTEKVKFDKKLLNIPDRIGTHSLRKTFGYHHYKQFDNIELLQKIFNHSYSAITLRYIGIEQDIIDESYMNFYL